VSSFLSKPARLFYRAGLGPGPKSGLRAGLTGLVLFGHLYLVLGNIKLHHHVQATKHLLLLMNYWDPYIIIMSNVSSLIQVTNFRQSVVQLVEN
jgi:hypothetical protein